MKKGRPKWPPFFIPDHCNPPVGASLLAKAVCQSTDLPDVNRLREQARSHSLNGVAFRCGTMPATFSHTRIDHAHERPPHT